MTKQATGNYDKIPGMFIASCLAFAESLSDSEKLEHTRRVLVDRKLVPADTLGGVLIGQRYDEQGAICSADQCERPSTIGGQTGVLVVTKCSGIATVAAFRREFVDPAAASIGVPMRKGTRVALALGEELGLAALELSRALTAAGWLCDWGSQQNVRDRPGSFDVTAICMASDGRARALNVSLSDFPPPLAGTAGKVTLLTLPVEPCTAGL